MNEGTGCNGLKWNRTEMSIELNGLNAMNWIDELNWLWTDFDYELNWIELNLTYLDWMNELNEGWTE